jgi:hypothetical protein
MSLEPLDAPLRLSITLFMAPSRISSKSTDRPMPQNGGTLAGRIHSAPELIGATVFCAFSTPGVIGEVVCCATSDAFGFVMRCMDAHSQNATFSFSPLRASEWQPCRSEWHTLS